MGRGEICVLVEGEAQAFGGRPPADGLDLPGIHVLNSRGGFTSSGAFSGVILPSVGLSSVSTGNGATLSTMFFLRLTGRTFT